MQDVIGVDVAALCPDTVAVLLDLGPVDTVALGNRRVLDLGAASTLDPGVRDLAAAYWAATLRFWERAERGDALGSLVVVTRTLHAAKQGAGSKGGRADLAAEADALAATGVLDDIADELLSAAPDHDWLERAPGVTALERDGNATALTVTCIAGDWPAVLGGAAGPGEISRTLTLAANHAAWRDRRVRRLCALTVTATEVWPDPVEWTGPEA